MDDAERVLLASFPDAVEWLSGHEAELAELPDSELDRLLDLPISIYGGG